MKVLVLATTIHDQKITMVQTARVRFTEWNLTNLVIPALTETTSLDSSWSTEWNLTSSHRCTHTP